MDGKSEVKRTPVRRPFPTRKATDTTAKDTTSGKDISSDIPSDTTSDMPSGKDTSDDTDVKDKRISHGAWSKHVRKRYTDLRTVEGQALKAIMDDLTEDLGGHENLTAGQSLLLDTLQSKLIVVLQISKYADEQPEIIKDDKLISCLGKNFLAYTNAIRLTLEALYKTRPEKKGQSLEEYLQQTYGSDDDK